MWHSAGHRRLLRVVIVPMRAHQPTLHYVKRRRVEGKSKLEIIRCIKRFVPRDLRLSRPSGHRRTFTARAGCVQAESILLPDAAGDLIQDAGWIGGQHRWLHPIRVTCASALWKRLSEAACPAIRRRGILGWRSARPSPGWRCFERTAAWRQARWVATSLGRSLATIGPG